MECSPYYESDVLAYFDGHVEERALYEAFFRRLCALFAAASLPVRRKKDWPKTCILVTFGLSHRLDSPRVAVAVEPYPNRWTHHVVVSSPQQLDDTLFAWIEEAYQFAESK